jgi:hypothetical protein
VALGRPFRQGGLDGLCGLYGVINATRLALTPGKCMKTAESGDFFAFLIARLHTDLMLRDAITEGLSAPAMSRLLVQADRWLQKRFGARLRTERPFYLQPGASRMKVVRSIARHLAVPNTSAMIVLDGGPRYLHWSVVKKVTAASLVLFDADGMSRVSIAKVRLLPRDVYLLKCER